MHFGEFNETKEEEWQKYAALRKVITRSSYQWKCWKRKASLKWTQWFLELAAQATGKQTYCWKHTIQWKVRIRLTKRRNFKSFVK